MPTITDAELIEYTRLKQERDFWEIQNSIRGCGNLRDDIDEPIRDCVAAMALLGLKPAFSCCGYDYPVQPRYKYHQYGRIYFIMSGWGISTKSPGGVFLDTMKSLEWNVLVSKAHNSVDLHKDFRNAVPMWALDPACPYHYESATWQIEQMRHVLWDMRVAWNDIAVLKDGNEYQTRSITQWHYQPKSPWVIRKKQIISEWRQ